jgi:hypothetical protein
MAKKMKGIKGKKGEDLVLTDSISSKLLIAVSAKNPGQKKALKAISENQVTFLYGAPGTGKTHCAVGWGIQELLKGHFDRVVFTRPYVEAGEKLGFLPGNFDAKMSWAVMPLYEVVSDYLSQDDIKELIENKKIVIYPLAYMRGCTFKRSYIVADECQNSTIQQMRMMLTRIGEGSKIVCTGDVEQSDLGSKLNGLADAMVGTVQEGRAASTLEALRKFTKTQATVARDGQEIQIQDTELVPGDIVILREGEKVPADCRILEQTSLEANESSITGESLPVEKHAETLSNPTTPLTEQKNMLFRGTLITRGSAKVVVTATGSSTHIGEISEKVALTTHEIPLQTHLKELANILILIVLGFSILLFIIGVWQGTSSVEMFGTVVALAVSVIPEGLPIAVTMLLPRMAW